MLRRVALLAFLPVLAACEKPRDRACRSLVLQARNATEARTSADRARSAARWIRTNAVEDADLRRDADELAAALDRFADARARLDAETAALGAKDAADVVSTAERLLAFPALLDRMRALTLRRCVEIGTTDDCAFGKVAAVEAQPDVTFSMRAATAARAIDEHLDRLEPRASAIEIRGAISETGSWAAVGPRSRLGPSGALDHANAALSAIAERGRADADVVRLASAIGAKCGS